MANVNKNAVILEALKFAREKCETANEITAVFNSIANLYEGNTTDIDSSRDVALKENSNKDQKPNQAKQK